MNDPERSSAARPQAEEDGTPEHRQPEAVSEGGRDEEAGGEAVATPVTSPLSAAIAARQEELEKTRDRLLRTAADFDNFKKRSKRELGEAAARAEDRVVLALTPVIDNLERAIAHAEAQRPEPTEDPDPTRQSLVDGVKMVHKQFIAALERLGVEPFESVGEVFDPELHEAIQQMHSEHPRGVVANELQRGYRREGRLVRPAMVVVSMGPAPDEPRADEEPAVAGDPDES